MRQTDLTLQELFEEFKSLNPRFPRCLVLNEIGEVFRSEGYEEIEDFLLELLDSESEDERFYAYIYLSTADNLKEDTQNKIKDFEKDLENTSLIGSAKEQIARRTGH